MKVSTKWKTYKKSLSMEEYKELLYLHDWPDDEDISIHVLINRTEKDILGKEGEYIS